MLARYMLRPCVRVCLLPVGVLLKWLNTGSHTHTHTRLAAFFPGLSGWAGTRKVKPIWILLKQETVSGSGISWDVCKSATCSRQITMPAPHHSVFYRPDALPAAQPTVSKHWRQMAKHRITRRKPHDSSGTRFFIPKISAKFDRGHPLRGRQMQVGWVKIGDFREIAGYISVGHMKY